MLDVIKKFKQKMDKLNRFKLFNDYILEDSATNQQINIANILDLLDNIDIFYNGLTDEYYLQLSNEDERIYDYQVYSLPDLQLVIYRFSSIANEIFDKNEYIYTTIYPTKLLLPCCNKILLINFFDYNYKKGEDLQVYPFYLGIIPVFILRHFVTMTATYKVFSFVNNNMYETKDIVSIAENLFLTIRNSNSIILLQPFTKKVVIQKNKQMENYKLLYDIAL
jgi:hypothetical protein